MTIKTYCGSEFWSYSLTENTTSPDWTECFRHTVLVWVPCCYMFIFAPFYIHLLKQRDDLIISHTWLNIAKSVIGCLLVALCAVDIGVHVYEHTIGQQLLYAYICTPAFRLLALTLAVTLVQLGRKKGVRSTGVLFIYWLLELIAVVFWLRSEIGFVVNDFTQNLYDLIWLCIYGFFVLVELVLAALVDSAPKSQPYYQGKNPSPETSASFLSVISFWWFTSLVVRGYKKALTREDLWSLNPSDVSKVIVPQFEKYWYAELSKAHRSEAQLRGKLSSSSSEQPRKRAVKSSHKNQDSSHELKPLQQQSPGDEPLPAVHAVDPGGAVYKPRFAWSLCRAYGSTFLAGSALKFFHDCLIFVSPVLLKLIIQFIEDPTQQLWKGYVYATLLLVTAFVQSMVLHQYFHRCFLTGMYIRSAIVAAVYKKALLLSSSARRAATVGEIVNLMSVDAQRFMELTTYLNMIWSAPFQMCVCLYFLWLTLGPSVLAGVGVMVIMVPINAVIARQNRKLQVEQMKFKDNRIKLMNEILNGIKVLKLYAWELSFQDQVLAIRKKELRVLRKSAYLNALSSFFWTCAPFLVSLTTFAVYVMSSPSNILNAQKAFVSLSLFNILRFPLSMLPMLIANLVQASVSVKRLHKFLTSEELDPSNVIELDKDSKIAISVREGIFRWDTPRSCVSSTSTTNQKSTPGTANGKGPYPAADMLPPALQDVNLDIKDGMLVAVVGQVGAGKSSLLSAILGEMDKIGGEVSVKGSVAYVAQQAWIQNASLRENILFGSSLRDTDYNKVVEGCALTPDLKILPAGDLTEIGEKGINLSGGQKQRVALARAVYADADVYLLDDPLSAVDSHVGKHIFDYVLSKEGLLKNKTRILVTHGLRFLKVVDRIVVVQDGRISMQGSYSELVQNSQEFAEFLSKFMEEEKKESFDLTEEELEARKDVISDVLVKTGSTQHKAMLRDNLEEVRQRANTMQSNTSLSGSKSSLNNGTSDDTDTNLLKQVLSKEDKEKEATGKEGKEKEGQEGERLIQTEKAETGNVKLSVFLAYINAIGPLISILILVMFALNTAAQVGANFWLSDWADDSKNAPNGTMDPSQRDLRLGVYGALGMIQGVATYVGSVMLAVGAMLASQSLHRVLLKRVLRVPNYFFDTTPMGRVVNRFAKDMDTIDDGLPMSVRGWLATTLHVLSTVFIIAYITPLALTVFIPVAIIYCLSQRFYVATSRQLKRLESVSRSPIYSHFGETVQGATTIRAFHQQKRFIEQSEFQVDENQTCYYASIVSNRWLAVRLEMVGNFIVFFSALFAVTGRNKLSGGIVGLSISYALNITQTLNWMVRTTSELETNIVSVERVKEYSEVPTEAEWVNPNKRPPSDWPDQGRVTFQGYSTRYREGLDLVLKNIACDITSGQKIGIVGRTGAGKSSLTLALFRIIEASSGSIIIDDIDISSIGLHDLRSKLTIIPQDPVLFSGTLRVNLDPFNVHTDEEVWTALEHAHLKSFISTLPLKLSHECSEGGENLSVGQRQLVCLARALLRKSRILVLDEATAAVDMETDELIQTTIRKEFKECTVITIAHRINTILDYSKLMVLDQGQIAEYDSPGNLLANRNSLFYSLAKDAGISSDRRP